MENKNITNVLIAISSDHKLNPAIVKDYTNALKKKYGDEIEIIWKESGGKIGKSSKGNDTNISIAATE